MDNERRQFNRVAFNTSATIHADDTKLDCEIIDLSLHGALVSLKPAAELTLGNSYRLNIPLSQDGEHISMELTLAHQESGHMGMECRHIDLDSITHLRRLIELNLGDSGLLERDFEALCQDNQ